MSFSPKTGAISREAQSIFKQNSFDSLSSDSFASMEMNSSTSSAVSTITHNKRTRDLALCAVLLDEWLKELAAISQEQSIVMLTDTFINHF